jgi:hypothetical protein
MRITQGLLHKLAKETIKQRQIDEPDLHAAYLTGSILDKHPLLGGTTDIDMVLVHKYQAPIERETKALTREVSLDIIHKKQEDYDQYRQLRQDPFMGYPLTRYRIRMFDTDHWLEFLQASVSADFHKPENVLARVNSQANSARENWFNLIQSPPGSHLSWLNLYLQSVSQAANAVSGLIGPPLTTRRFMMTFREQVESLGVPDLYSDLTELLGYTVENEGDLKNWVGQLSLDFESLKDSSELPARLSGCRQTYYLDALQAFVQSGDAKTALWPMLRVWLDIQILTKKTSPASQDWEACLSELRLTEDDTSQKIDFLDAFLDRMEVTIEAWSNKYGY